jgi:hypothetical protein
MSRYFVISGTRPAWASAELLENRLHELGIKFANIGDIVISSRHLQEAGWSVESDLYFNWRGNDYVVVLKEGHNNIPQIERFLQNIGEFATSTLTTKGTDIPPWLANAELMKFLKIKDDE